VSRHPVGWIRGRYYADYVDDVRSLRRQGRETEVQALLLELVDATEAESRLEKWSVAPWYYEQLAISYRKCRNAEAEISILERYARQVNDPANPLRVRLWRKHEPGLPTRARRQPSVAACLRAPAAR
jgi:hypothetical protein